MCLYVNKRWCTVCSPDIELLTISLRPFYLPREFNQIFITVVYIQPKADVNIASSKIAEITQDLELKLPDSLKLILGDCNNCQLESTHITINYVNIPTRGDRTLDKCYGNVADGYKAYYKKAGLGASDHDMVHLMPK